MTFKVSDKNDYNERYSSYVIQSGQFPQQTSLLGMMRFLLLSNSSEAFDTINLKIISTEKAREIIGAQGFVITKDYASNNFEKIKNISPCFLEMSVNEGVWTTLLPAPKDYGYNVSLLLPLKFLLMENKEMPPSLQDMILKNGKKIYILETIRV